MMRARLPLTLAGVYTLLVLYASLHPFSGWHDSGIEPLAFLAAGWPRYFTGFDLTVNALAYLPLGFLWAAALSRSVAPVLAILLVTLGSAGFSLGIEALQNYLPSRVPSNLDLVSNAAGALLGALVSLPWGHDLFDGGRLHAWRQRRFLHGPYGDIGLVLVALWLLTQLNPETILFGNGNLRSLLGLPAALPFEAEDFLALEMASVAAQTWAIALIAARLAINHPLLLPPALILAALAVKSFALLLLLNGDRGLAWATPGSLGGLGLGLLLWIAVMPLPAALRQALAALALMFAAVLANLMPDNPYLEDTLRTWQQGHFLNFNGLTRLATALWPFLALPWLMLSRTRHDPYRHHY
jgi:VanZ family protein